MLRMALIGCGRIGTKKHIEALIQNSDRIETVVLCDIERERAEKCAEIIEKRIGRKPEVEKDYVKILKRGDIDAVAIATESGKHYEITMEALTNNKHVLVEKPIALSTKHADEMIELAKKKNLKLEVCFQNRFNPPIQELRKKVEEGAFGKIHYGVATIRWNRNEEYYKQASWRGTWAQDGGALMNQCTHNIDLLQWMLGGEIEEVYGIIKNFNHPYIEAEDFGGAIVKFKDGKVGIIEGTTTIYPRNLHEKLGIFGEKGTVVIGGLAVNRIEEWRFEGEEGHPFMNLPDPDTVYGFGHVPLYKDFYEAIEKDRKPYISGEDGKKAVEIVLAIYKSALEGKPVKFPFNFSTNDMKGVILK
ncbi:MULTISPECIES: Gfo/Idh/MocA family oxidoreductase [unclassified Thermosipho (in: thermotogales)]|uniref:Gfo/Idh/MocA family protein n=1 Tax=unclassified Thermosipho (in: thermotogales) TaxID=2676525 RepID=UPI000985D48A|nr:MULTISPECIES: Gfo/Idh/MocA family oxidoreductase [unclassified Thermosipho (in: thermotogales)]MBT1248110.1 oxidoreductase [Thermosipho sp. 1244]OOC46698.1 oxidoreductase [Thermosipho sp. 1223]